MPAILLARRNLSQDNQAFLDKLVSGSDKRGFFRGSGKGGLTSNARQLAILSRSFPEQVQQFCIKDSVADGNHQVQIIPVDKTPYNDKSFLDLDPRVVCAGGLSAAISTLLLAHASRDLKPVFIDAGSECSDAGPQPSWKKSGFQVHVRHANRMSDDPEYSGLNILRHYFSRVFRGSTIEDAQRVGYLNVDFDWEGISENFAVVLQICLLNELITWTDMLKRRWGCSTKADLTYPLAQDSVDIYKWLNRVLGEEIFRETGAINIALSERYSAELQAKANRLLLRYGLSSRVLCASELSCFNLSPDFLDENGRAVYFPTEGSLSPNVWRVLREGMQRFGATVWTGSVLKQVVTDVESANVLGLVVSKNGCDEFIRTDGVYLSLGAFTEFNLHPGSSLRSPIESTTTAAGFSGYALVPGVHHTPLATRTNHWTPIATAVDPKMGPVTLVKATGGAVIGGNAFHTAHAAHNIWLGEQIYGGRIEYVAAHSCSRSLNSGNTAKFTWFAKKAGAMTGAGGKGVTEAASIAMIAANCLLPFGTKVLRPVNVPRVSSQALVEQGFFAPRSDYLQVAVRRACGASSKSPH